MTVPRSCRCRWGRVMTGHARCGCRTIRPRSPAAWRAARRFSTTSAGSTFRSDRIRCVGSSTSRAPGSMRMSSNVCPRRRRLRWPTCRPPCWSSAVIAPRNSGWDTTANPLSGAFPARLRRQCRILRSPHARRPRCGPRRRSTRRRHGRRGRVAARAAEAAEARAAPSSPTRWSVTAPLPPCESMPSPPSPSKPMGSWSGDSCRVFAAATGAARDRR